MKKSAYVIAIAGGSGSGKSWLATHLQQKLGSRATLLAQDWYYRDRTGVDPQAARKLNFDHPRAIEQKLFLEHLETLRRGQPVARPLYNYATHIRSVETQSVPAAPVVIVEGLFLLHDARLAERFDDSIFVDVPADVRLARRIRRDAAQRAIDLGETLRLYETFVRPMHERFIQPSAARARKVWRPLEERAFPRQLVQELKNL
jgi:uridine kinase